MDKKKLKRLKGLLSDYQAAEEGYRVATPEHSYNAWAELRKTRDELSAALIAAAPELLHE